MTPSSPQSLPEATTSSGKPRYEILDGLRGVAALTVVLFHLFEAHSGGDAFVQKINHGYLAVDFFFMLSGFVLGYAYEDRWHKMGYLDFARRRLIRLQPMVVMGGLVGAVCFYFGASEMFPAIAATPVWKFVLIGILGALLVPVPQSGDIRGWNEMYPLNGPAWTLFFEYLANAAYALVLRRLAVRTLAFLALVAGIVTFHYLLTGSRADMIGGWSLDAAQLRVGFTRLAYPFVAGLLVFRLGRLIPVRHGFWVCAVVLVTLLSIPRLGTRDMRWPNALYEAVCITCVFPLIVATGAGSHLSGSRSRSVCLFLGRLSYPLYISHYPFIYLYTAWVARAGVNIRAALPMMAATLFAILTLAYLSLRFFDEPLRARLNQPKRT
ncbi:MAG: acyltransferase [Nibricoccus sp.]